MKPRVNNERVIEIGITLRSIGIIGAKYFESLDPQMDIARELVSKCSNNALYLLALNSLVSYSLTMRGEIFWKEFSKYVLLRCREIESFHDIVKIVKEFTMIYNRYLLNQKIRRLDRIMHCKDIVNYINNVKLVELRNYIAKCLDSDPDSKTIVFSIKMIYYGLRALGYDYTLPFDIPIPVDRRVARISSTSGVIECESLKPCNIEYVLHYPKIIIKAWNEIGKTSSIPPLHIDAIIWYFGGFSNATNRNEILNAIDRRLIDYFGIEKIRELINNLFYQL
ncbi:DNA-(apurinic or apyrimidinic site) lyase [Ignisphaera aggregans DSM 17230]|uniref:DNA-(Apurinic or apyrimidinic site) lyase n=1 Tax=Ignisphaera aggregans (strain DSM 17230 / JCM 13409 / AQ1.S1) TaxID=583356 RepID=E0SQK5_IGNAA|nr:DNA-(apurinic or apyrimidinic site) lyase [Ignisphaera aggregans DSM 17230]